MLLLLLPGPSDADELTAAAEAFARGQPARVVEALGSGSLSPEGRLLRGRALVELKRHAEAKRDLADLPQALPLLRDLAQLLHAEALLGTGNAVAAAEEFRTVARTKNSRWIDLAWSRRADALFAAKRYGAAAEEYRHVLRVQPKNPLRPELELQLARCQEAQGQTRKAAAALQEVWLRHPTSDAAVRARQRLDRLPARMRPKAPTLSRLVERARQLRRAKRFDEALVHLRALRGTAREARREIEREIAGTLIAAGRPAEALVALQALAPRGGRPASPSLREQMADCHARLGRVDEGVQHFLRWAGPPGSARPTAVQQEELTRAARFLTDHGRYARALEIYERLAKHSRPGAERKLRLAWLAYRAGQYAVAVERLEAAATRAGRSKDFKLYWQARAHARAGNGAKSEELYRQILADNPRTYYGLVARTRLVESGKVQLRAGSCPAVTEAAVRAATAAGEVQPRLAALIARHGNLYPSLRRVQALWQLGMIDDARRELQLVAIDAAWIAARGRPREWIQRPEVERLWRGGPLERRVFGKREREVLKEGVALRHQLGALLSAAGISHFAWQLGAPDADPERRRHPRAYYGLVLENAKRFGLDPNLIWAIMRTESTYRLDVISRVGATGLMQIMPNTGRRIAAAMKLKSFQVSQLFEPELNVQMASWYLRALQDKFRGQVPLMAAGYNGGPHHVARWLDQHGKGAEMDEFIEEIPFSESRRYAKKIMRLLALYERLYCGRDDRRAVNTLNVTYLPQPDF